MKKQVLYIISRKQVLSSAVCAPRSLLVFASLSSDFIESGNSGEPTRVLLVPEGYVGFDRIARAAIVLVHFVLRKYEVVYINAR